MQYSKSTPPVSFGCRKLIRPGARRRAGDRSGGGRPRWRLSRALPRCRPWRTRRGGRLRRASRGSSRSGSRRAWARGARPSRRRSGRGDAAALLLDLVGPLEGEPEEVAIKRDRPPQASERRCQCGQCARAPRAGCLNPERTHFYDATGRQASLASLHPGAAQLMTQRDPNALDDEVFEITRRRAGRGARPRYVRRPPRGGHRRLRR